MIDHTDPGHPPDGPRRGGRLSRASRAAKRDEDADAPPGPLT